ncbi:MAG: DUF3108 domain-containing protein [Bacteroidaceae bacterium]|nr:DUF3108 domain-containing protein [Bacteroidaceae bacterium]
MRRLLFLLALILAPLSSHAQCEMENTAFKSGEVLIYDLYFNWKFIWVKVGSATMTTIKSIYNGQDCFRSSLLTRGNKTADKLFVMRDTLMSIVTPQLAPIYYRKGALEGGQYRVDEVWYSYPDGKCSLRQRYRNPHGEISTAKYVSATDCVQDMMSMFLRARSFDPSSWRKGQRIHFKMADGSEVKDKVLVYRGREKFTMRNTGVVYRCLVLSFVENEDGKERDIVTFYVTDDANHMPVRLDLNLNFGSAKAFVSAQTGLRHPLTSIVK